MIGAYGFGEVESRDPSHRPGQAPPPVPELEDGSEARGDGLYFRLFRDTAFVEEATPVLARYVRSLGRQIDASSTGLLPRERFSQDIADAVVGLHAQAVVWQGLGLMGAAWAGTGHPELAATCRRLAMRLGGALRRAVRASARLADGSLFVPVRLLDDELPYAALTASRGGTYWNLVMPYALASGLFEPGDSATAALSYMLRHGSRLLGLVRAGAYALYGGAGFPVGGTDQVYGLNMSRFLADNDRPDQLVLSLYGQLAAAMTRGTFVSGETASVSPLHGERYRTMFLPPNGTSNASFLETLRLMLVHETSGRGGRPQGLELAYATPRGMARTGEADRGARRADQLRPGVVLDPLRQGRGPRIDRRADAIGAPKPQPPLEAPPGASRDGDLARRTALPRISGRRRDCRSAAAPGAARARRHRPVDVAQHPARSRGRAILLARSRGYGEYPPDGGRLVRQNADSLSADAYGARSGTTHHE